MIKPVSELTFWDIVNTDYGKGIVIDVRDKSVLVWLVTDELKALHESAIVSWERNISDEIDTTH